MFDRQRKYAIRKIAIGTISAVIGSFMVGATDVSAKEVSVDYKYVTLNELTEDEKKLIKTNQHELVATEDKTYYMVYRPTSALPATSASKLADNMIGAGLAMGSVLLLAAVSVGKNRRKRLTSLIVLTTAGTSIIAPNAFAIENKELRRYNQELTLYSQADLPDPLRIDGYEFVGYIELDKEEATVETKVKEEIDLPSKPVVTTRSVTQSLVKDVIDGATKVATEAPVTKAVTEAPVTRVITEAPVTKVVTEAPVTKVVTQQPAPIVVSNDETTQVVTQAPITQIVTETPVTRVVTEAPVTKVVTEKPKETLVVEEKPTIIIETSKPKENLVIEEKPELKVVQGTEERIVEKQDIPFSTRYEEDANMWEGETKVVRPGTQGQKEIVDTYPTVNGLIVSNPSRTERVVKEATEQVEKRGTKQVQGQVEEVVTESITTQVEYVENINAVAGEKSTVAEGKDGLKEIHNLYETIKDEKTKL
ncbi:MAG: G5 domain-containing protein, partial [Gemella sp.]|nr:G5 domain-containing protein [Gemella sp.]